MNLQDHYRVARSPGRTGVYLFVSHSPSSSDNTTPKADRGEEAARYHAGGCDARFRSPAQMAKSRPFTKTGVNWQMTEPMNTPADNSLVDQLVRDVTGLVSQGQLDACAEIIQWARSSELHH